jgi:hypothetical protein
MNDTTRIPLNGAGAYLERDGDCVAIHAPYLFARRFLSVPIAELAVQDQARAVGGQRQPSPELRARTRIIFLPTGTRRLFQREFPFNLCLLFRSRVKLPRVRPTAVHTRFFVGPQRGFGAWANGLFVSAVDPRATEEQLVAWSVTRAEPSVE